MCRLCYKWDYLMPGICSLINPTSIKKMMSFPATIHALFLWYYIYHCSDKGGINITYGIKKRHTISHPNGQAMVCLSGDFWRKTTPLKQHRTVRWRSDYELTKSQIWDACCQSFWAYRRPLLISVQQQTHYSGQMDTGLYAKILQNP